MPCGGSEHCPGGGGGMGPYMILRAQFSSFASDPTAWQFLTPDANHWRGYISDTSVYAPPVSDGPLFEILTPGMYLMHERTHLSGAASLFKTATAFATTPGFNTASTTPRDLDTNAAVHDVPPNVITANFADPIEPFASQDIRMILLDTWDYSFPAPMPIGVAIRGGNAGDDWNGICRLLIQQVSDVDQTTAENVYL